MAGGGESAKLLKKKLTALTQEGVWSLLRSWLRPYRGGSLEKLPFYVAHFEWLYNLRQAGKAHLQHTLLLLFQPDLRTYEPPSIRLIPGKSKTEMAARAPGARYLRERAKSLSGAFGPQ